MIYWNPMILEIPLILTTKWTQKIFLINKKQKTINQIFKHLKNTSSFIEKVQVTNIHRNRFMNQNTPYVFLKRIFTKMIMNLG